MQSDDKEIGLEISKTQVNASPSHDNDHNSGENMQGNFRKSYEERGNKPAENMIHQSSLESQKMRPEEKSLDY